MSNSLSIINTDNYGLQKMKSGGGTITINADGQYDVSNYDNANVDVYKIKITDGMVLGYSRVKVIPDNYIIDISEATKLDGFWGYGSKLETVPMLNTAHITSMKEMFKLNTAIKNIPLYDTSGITAEDGFEKMFSSASVSTSETNPALYNILQMCINAVNYPGTKTLKELGLSSSKATACQSRSNWDDFVAAGWSTGY